MDNVYDDATSMKCTGSGSAGVLHTNVTENNKEYKFYECPTCGILLPTSPIKDHHRMYRGDR